MWVWWVVAALGLGAVEVMSLDLVFAMLAAGALAGAVTAALAGTVLSLVVAPIVAIAMLAAVRPIALSHLHTPTELRTGVAALIGRPALVLEAVDRSAGRVRIGGEVWSARSYDEYARYTPGQTVDVVQIEGATAVVLGREIGSSGEPSSDDA